MTTHHIAATWALFDEDITPHMGTVGVQFMSYDRYDKKSNPNAFGSTFMVAGTAMKTNDYANARGDLFGPDLHAFMKRAAKGLTRINCFGEELPRLDNRVELASDKDEFGMPLAKLTHSFDDDAVALWNANFEQGVKVAKATGAKEVWPGKGPVIPTTHLHGGAIMGTSAANSVTNSYGQTHEIPNLWMAGPCVFPTEGASNPTYTIFAVSQRGAEHLASNWNTIAN
jgi:choline dehydrogenase-like flavoprotein